MFENDEKCDHEDGCTADDEDEEIDPDAAAYAFLARFGFFSHGDLSRFSDVLGEWLRRGYGDAFAFMVAMCRSEGRGQYGHLQMIKALRIGKSIAERARVPWTGLDPDEIAARGFLDEDD